MLCCCLEGVCDASELSTNQANHLSWKMESPFIIDPVELGAGIVRGSLRKGKVFGDRQTALALPDDFLDEQCRFWSEGMTMLQRLIQALYLLHL